MKHVILVLAMLTAGLAAATDHQPAVAKTVRAEGCVEHGVETGCLVVKDLKSGVLYNIRVKSQRPEVGTGIEFTGTPSEGLSYCMQGIAVDVEKWVPKSSLRCSPRPALPLKK